MSALRRIRGLVGFAVVSAIAWIPLGWFATVVMSYAYDSRLSWGRLYRQVPELAAVGFVCGLISAAILAAAERRRSVGQLSYARMGLWGFIGSNAVAAAFIATTGTGWSDLPTAFAIFGAIGATTSVGALTLARRAPAAESLPAGDESPDKSLAP